MKELRTQRPIGRKKFSTKKDAIFQNPEALINEIKFQLTANPTCSAVISKMLTSQIKDKSKKDDLEKLTLLHDLVISILSYFEENRLTLDQNLTTPLRQLRFYVVEQFNAILPKVKIIPSSTIESWIYAGTENNPKLFAIPDKEKATQASYSILQEIPDESFKKLFSSISPDDHELHENLRILLSNHQPKFGSCRESYLCLAA